MKKEVLLVAKDKWPFLVLAEMGERTKNSWIFFHRNVISAFQETLPLVNTEHSNYIIYEWEKAKTTLYVDNFLFTTDEWIKVLRIDADNIAFTIPSKDPEEIFFMKMDE